SALNRLRDSLKLARFTLDPRLSAAASGHALYLHQNVATGHQQVPGRPGFIGENPWDRTRAYGFSGGTWEAAGYQTSDPQLAIATIFDAPYHRIPFMNPAVTRVGVGISPRGTVVDGEVAVANAVVTSPSRDQVGVPTTWNGNERPNPLRRFPHLQGPVGYPIVFTAFGSDSKLDVTTARLERAGTPVDSILNTPSNDENLTNAAMLMPTEPLRPRTSYTVEFIATKDGVNVSRRWSFVTGD
ncbi:MAG: hypothetical protein C4320_06310, partial [Armatimonadota bacterium]